MANYIRTQILLKQEQRDQLDEIARETGLSLSELVRDFVDAQIRTHTYENLRQAAQKLKRDYAADSNLTNMTALDSEDFLNE